MKKTVKRRNGRKSVKKNAKKRVSTRKNKQRGGDWIKQLLFAISVVCVITGLFVSMQVPTQKAPKYGDILVNQKYLTKFQECLITQENEKNSDPYDKCSTDRNILMDTVDRENERGIVKCMNNEYKKIEDGEYKLPSGSNEVTHAVNICYKKNVEKNNEKKARETKEKCTSSFFTSQNIDSDCHSGQIINLYLENTLKTIGEPINIGNNDVMAYNAKFDGQNGIVFKKGDFAISSPYINNRIDLHSKEFQKIISYAVKIVSDNPKQNAQNMVFLGNGKLRYIFENSGGLPIIIELHHIPDEMYENLYNKHLAQLPDYSSNFYSKDRTIAYPSDYSVLKNP